MNGINCETNNLLHSWRRPWPNRMNSVSAAFVVMRDLFAAFSDVIMRNNNKNKKKMLLNLSLEILQLACLHQHIFFKFTSKTIGIQYVTIFWAIYCALVATVCVLKECVRAEHLALIAPLSPSSCNVAAAFFHSF